MTEAVADISSLDISSRKAETPWTVMVVMVVPVVACLQAGSVCSEVWAGPGEWREV